MPKQIGFRKIGQVSLGNASNLSGWEWQTLNNRGLYIYHSVRDINSKLLDERAEGILSKWDIISTSLVNKHRFHGVGNVGLILKVPAQNIISTSPKSLHFPNRIGLGSAEAEDVWALSDRIASGVNLAGTCLASSFRFLLNPETIMAKTQDYNEVLVVGRPGIKLYQDYPHTEKIEVWHICRTGEEYDVDIYQRLRLCNPGVRTVVLA
ncbi:MAG TPA: hypothetical protein DHV72_00525 [Serratia grimesii]|uniref:Uncharacterized protein n=1 Tax=Serratia grimesii TaxID=82995 RepID=A0A9C7V5L8_9GAMM|nr:hypothetical protein [Serratia grimesii]HCJ98502.1 hypothetical protein [Serratia grimesii]